MPIYIFQHPKTQEILEIVQKISETHEYIDKEGIKWDRVFTKPYASIDSKIDPFSAKDFVEKTGRKKGTVGDLWDKSAELSEKRGDSVEQKYQNWSKNRKNRKHPEQNKKELKSFLDSKGFELTD